MPDPSQPEPERIEFNRRLYRDDAVEAAVEAYGHLAKLTLERTEHFSVVQVSDPDERVADRLVDALCNHVLYETVARARAEQGAT